MITIDLVYFNAGGGHRAAALALQGAIAQQQRPWNVRLVNLFEVLDSRGRFRQVFGAPSYVIDGEIFWGQDRLDFVDRKLASA